MYLSKVVLGIPNDIAALFFDENLMKFGVLSPTLTSIGLEPSIDK
jgi:hypothetical protein